MEMLQSIQQLNKAGEDVSAQIAVSESVNALIEIDRMNEPYNELTDLVDWSLSDPQWLTDDLIKHECIRKLHHHFVSIVSSIDQVGFMQFSTNVASAISEIKTKYAYEDMMYALACVYNLYVAYTQSKFRCQAGRCLVKSKLITVILPSQN